MMVTHVMVTHVMVTHVMVTHVMVMWYNCLGAAYSRVWLVCEITFKGKQ